MGAVVKYYLYVSVVGPVATSLALTPVLSSMPNLSPRSPFVFLWVMLVSTNIIIHRKHVSYPHQGTAAPGSNMSYPQVKHELSTELSTGGAESVAVKVKVPT